MGSKGSKITCMIVTVFLLMLGMCQSRVGTDFFFVCDANGQMQSRITSQMQRTTAAEIVAAGAGIWCWWMENHSEKK